MKAQTGVNRYLLNPATTIPQRRVRPIGGPNSDAEEGDMETGPGQPSTGTSLVRRSFAPLVESPGSVYLVGVGLGIGCAGLVVVLLLGMLSLE
ncbi:MAG: hypothetical protein WBM00_07060 [Solirubrobacterales bacterium]